ncbi:MAG: ADP-heptose:LPS heptosyltransferase [Salibacteraceae bacterium]
MTSIVGKLTLTEELELISNLDIMLSMDSGNGHLAAMFGLPVITLWGVTHPFAGFAPFGQAEGNSILSDREQFPFIPTSIYGNKFPAGYEEVMKTIEPKTVVAKIIDLL